MANLQSNADAILVAIPMLALLFAGFFRLDELVGKPKNPSALGHPMSGIDKDGNIICVEPDGNRARIRRKVR